MVEYNIIIQGQPIARKNIRYVFQKGKMVEFDPQETIKKTFAWMCRAECGNIKVIEGAFILHADFFVTSKNITKNEWNKLEGSYRIEKPKYSDYIRFVLASLEKSFFIDESHCIYIQGGKFRSANPRTEIRIERINP